MYSGGKTKGKKVDMLVHEEGNLLTGDMERTEVSDAFLT